jgi:hypothetical protein
MEYTDYKIPDDGYNLIYRKYNRNEGILEELVGYELTDGNKVYLIEATYVKSLRPNKYYVVAPNPKAAKSKFKNTYTWLGVISSVAPVEGDLLGWVLSHPKNVSFI